MGVRGCGDVDYPSAPVWKNTEYEYAELLFSLQYQNRGDLFEGLSVWSDPEYQKIQGTYPVIYLMEETVQTALEQFEKKQYDAELLARGIEKERIRHYGFAFEGKQVLIG